MTDELFKPKLLYRTRINKLLERIFNVPLYIMVAPMGYGKTTAVRNFLNSKKGVKYSWFVLNEDEKDEIWLWQKICGSLASIDAELSRQMVEFGFPRSAFEYGYVIDLINSALTEPSILVIDDYHLNNNKSVDHIITILASACIPNFHIVIISRTYPNLPSEELVIKGVCHAVEQDVLEFSNEETIEIFEKNGFSLTPDEQNILSDMTCGWAAAIFLALLKYAENKSLQITTSNVSRMIKNSIFDKLSKEKQNTLIKLSVLDSITLEQAVFITGSKNAARIIHKLARDHCFIRYDNKNNTYYIHSLLKALLQELFDVSGMDKITLFCRSGDWFAENGDRIEAIKFYHKAGKSEKILDIFELYGSSELMDKAPKLIMEVFADIDLSLKLSRPIAYITYIYSLLTWNGEAGAGMLLEAKTVYEADEKLKDKSRVLGEITLAESFLYFNDAIKMNEYQKKARILLAGSSSRIANPDAIFTFGSPHMLFLYHNNKNELLRLVEAIEKDINNYIFLSSGCGTGAEYLARAEYFLETGNLASAEPYAKKAVFSAKTKNQISIIISADFCFARYAVLCGNLELAYDLLEKMRIEAESTGNPILLKSADIASGIVFSSIGRLDLIPKWLRNVQISGFTLEYQLKNLAYIVLGKTAVLENNYAELEAIADTMLELYKTGNNIFGQIYALIYKAIAKYHYNTWEANECMSIAAELAQADGIVTPFAENIPFIETILSGLELNQIWKEKVFYLGDRFKNSFDAVNINSGIIIGELTNRETEVLQWLAQGLKQIEIAEKLFISQNTIRRHLENIYTKLDVNNKIQAINIAKEHKMI
jgi:LuxR family maltose regulon positive regulatory protein